MYTYIVTIYDIGSTPGQERRKTDACVTGHDHRLYRSQVCSENTEHVPPSFLETAYTLYNRPVHKYLVGIRSKYLRTQPNYYCESSLLPQNHLFRFRVISQFIQTSIFIFQSTPCCSWYLLKVGKFRESNSWEFTGTQVITKLMNAACREFQRKK